MKLDLKKSSCGKQNGGKTKEYWEVTKIAVSNPDSPRRVQAKEDRAEWEVIQ